MSDLERHFYNQPLLYAGWNFDALNEWEFNSAGRNEPIWPELFETFQPLTPFIITADLLAGFEGCADITIAPENDTITIRPELEEITIRRGS